MMDQTRLVRTVLECGATKATVISQAQIVLSPTFRDICKANQCGGYGACWMCPPYVGEIEDLMEKVRSYPYGIWYQTVFPLEDSYDIEGMFEASGSHAQVSQRIQEAVTPLLEHPVLHLTCGGCHLCDVCAVREKKPCRKPDKALSSLEAYGFDVYKTTKDTGLSYINGANTVTYFGIVLFSE